MNLVEAIANAMAPTLEVGAKVIVDGTTLGTIEGFDDDPEKGQVVDWIEDATGIRRWMGWPGVRHRMVLR